LLTSLVFPEKIKSARTDRLDLIFWLPSHKPAQVAAVHLPSSKEKEHKKIQLKGGVRGENAGQ
jgi:hypothetical protein